VRLGILIDGRIARWQLQALERVRADHELFLLVCNGHPAKHSPRHALYYLLNLFTVQNRLTRKVKLPPNRLKFVEIYQFSPTFDGAWATLPEDLLEWIAARKLDAIVKFGLGLLRVPSAEALPIPILSYHHGDPRKYRGRPAGFYELVDKESFVGQVVQALGSKLDAGTIYAFAESRVIPSSYRRTLIEAYRLSPYLLSQALENVRLGRPIDIRPDGRNYRLPSNAAVVRFCAVRLWQSVLRAFYGAFIEKRWKVATAPVAPAEAPVRAIEQAEGAAWSTLPLGPRYSFYADPFFGHDAGEIFVEALNRRTGKGEVVRVMGEQQQSIIGFGGHVSYPAPVDHDGRQLLVPETVNWLPLTAFDVADGRAIPVNAVDIDEPKILDPTFLPWQGRIYLFGNMMSEGENVLHLWHADDLRSRFERHPASPIRVSARGSRMAGELAEWNGQLYRLGQDWRRSYGDGILAFRITHLSPTEYREELAGEACFKKVRGPHTVNRRGERLLFDYYTEGFSPFAGIRRLLGRF
jgi:hypothetical protein